MHVWHKGPKGGPAGEAGAQLTECGGWNVAQCAAFWWLHGRTVLQNGMFSFFFCTKGQPRASGGRVALHRRRFVLTGGQSTAADEQRTSADDGQRSLMGWCSVEIEASWNPAFFFVMRYSVAPGANGQALQAWFAGRRGVIRPPSLHGGAPSLQCTQTTHETTGSGIASSMRFSRRYVSLNANASCRHAPQLSAMMCSNVFVRAVLCVFIPTFHPSDDEWRIPSSKGEHVRTPGRTPRRTHGRTNRHTHSPFTASPPPPRFLSGT